MKKRKVFIRSISIFGVFVAFFLLYLAVKGGEFGRIKNLHFEKKQIISNIFGAEDITIDQESGFAYISSDDRWKKAERGDIFLLDLNIENPVPINLTKNSTLKFFKPHGISLIKLPDGRKQLYAISHRPNKKQFVEIFEVKDTTLIHIESITSELFIAPNDIVAVGDKKFYLTNMNTDTSGWAFVKSLLSIPTGNVIFYSDGKSKIVSKPIQYANGINISKDGKTLLVASASGNEVLIYDIDHKTGEINQKNSLEIKGGDNIEIDTDGNHFIACHPKLLRFLLHARFKIKSPSRIVKISKNADNQYTTTKIFEDDGAEISGSSVGAVWKDKIVIGNVFEDKILVYTMK